MQTIVPCDTMSLRFKQFEKITADDLDILIREEITEQIYLEYKRELPSENQKERIEFLKDITSFANARGGYIIYGIEEENGLPKGYVPIPKSRADQEILRLTQMIEFSIRPRIQGSRMREIILPSGDCIIVVKVSPSYNRPHMVTYQNQSKFYSRNSKGVFQMDVDEIKEMVLSSQDLVNRIRKFREDRIKGIVHGNTPVSTSSWPYVILHVIPLDSFGIGKNIELSKIEKTKKRLSILGLDIHELRYNFDGVLGHHYSEWGNREYIDGYIQVYRNGCIEMLRTLWDWDQKYPQTIPAISIENWILKSLDSLYNLIDVTEIEFPVSIGVTLLGFEAYRITLLPYISGQLLSTAEAVDRKEIVIPEIVIEDSTTSIESIMLPVFNTMWNSAAWPGSYAYDENKTRNENYSWTENGISKRFPI